MLRSESVVVPLKNICDDAGYQYFGYKYLKTFSNTTCEEDILSKNDISSCTNIKLNKRNSLEYILKINQYIVIFPEIALRKKICKKATT